MTSYHPTHEQLDAIEAARHAVVYGKDNDGIKIIAFAGGGKTSTMRMIAQDLSARGLKGIYLAFNRDIANEAKRSMPHNIDARTFHSLAYQQTPDEIKRKLNNFKAFFPKNFQSDFKIHEFTIKGDTTRYKVKGKVNDSIWISNYRQYIVIKAAIERFLLDMTVIPEKKHIIDSCESVLKAKIDSQNKELLAGNLIAVLRNLWSRFKDPYDEYKISPSVYLKLWALSEPQINFDFILFDEAQDSDKLMLDVLGRQKAKVIYVGDPHQQIYEWRGAVNAMSSIKYPAYYLTKSFRFGQAIADYAGAILTHLGENNKMYGIEKPCEVDTKTEYPIDMDAILCRTNIGVIESVLVYNQSKDGLKGRKVLPCNIDIQETITLLHDIEKFRINDPSLCHNKHIILSNFRDFAELSEFCSNSSFDTIITPTFRLYDNYGFAEICRILTETQHLDPRFDDVIVSTTAHKAKGLEWEKVFLWSDFNLMISEENRQNVAENKSIKGSLVNASEARLLYVTLTRAKSKLYSRNVHDIIDMLQKSNNQRGLA